MKSTSQRSCFVISSRHRLWISLIVWLSGWCLSSASWGLEIAQQKWGFDGLVRSQQFNLLSVQLSNPGTNPFDGEVRLERIQGFDVVDAPILETLYLAPGTSRWVQFYPWIDEVGFTTFRLVWGKGAKERGSLSSPRGTKDRPALVVLEQSGQIVRPNVGTGGFAEELFPRSVTGCAGLGGVILDHEPRWSESQQQAFLDWIRLGGELHVVQGSAGRLPGLTGLLAVLDRRGGSEKFGAGRIQQHDLPLSSFDREVIRSRILQSSRWKREKLEFLNQGVANEEPIPEAGDNLFSNQNLEVDDPLLRNLKQLTRAQHSWVLIHFLSLLFLTLVFPGVWWLGQSRRGDYRLVFGTLLSTIAVFSLIFLWIGRRGAGESTLVDSLLLAERSDVGRYRVSGWSNVFVTTGGDYELKHDGSGRMYSSGQSSERMRGIIRSGAEAALIADMPPFSSRTLLSRIEATAPDVEARIRQVQIGTGQATRYEFKSDRLVNKKLEMVPLLQNLELELTVKDGGVKPLAAWAVFHQQVYALNLSESREVAAVSIASCRLGGQPLPQFFRVEDGFMGGLSNFGPYGYGYSGELDRQAVYTDGIRMMIQAALEFHTTRDVLEFELSSDRIRVFIETELPRQFWLQGEQLQKQQGRCLFCLDVPVELNQ